MVASYSPHRQHGETATLFSRPHSESPSSRHHIVLHSPTSYTSPFAITLPVAGKTRSATRRLTPLKSRALPTAPDSPIKFPLTLTTHNNMNSSGMTLRSGSSSPRAASPRDKLAAQRQNRAGIGVENKDGHKPPNGSPLKRSDGIMNLNEASRGSPVAKRRSQAGVGLFSSINKAPTFGSPSFGVKSSPSPKRQSGLKKNPAQIFGDKPTWAKSRPLARTDFMTPSDPASKLRRVTSVENFLETRDSPFGNQVAPLANPSIHLFNGNSANHPHPLSQTFNQPISQASGDDDEFPSSQNSNAWVTPQNYKTAKPFPAAFHSTGFVTKRGRLLNQEKEHGPQPDTPTKPQPDTPSRRPIGPPLFSQAFQTKGFLGKSRGLSMSMTEFASSSSPRPSDLENESDKIRWKTLARKTSAMSNDDGEDTGSEYELPPTPTKKFNGTKLFGSGGGNGGGSGGSSGGGGGGGNKRLRTDTSGKYNLRLQMDKKSNTALLAEGLRGRYVTTPHTPRENLVPPDLSSVSISGRANNASKKFLPVTPSPSKENFHNFRFGNQSTATHAVESTDGRTVQVSDNFVKRFTEVKHIGSGQFSEVYQVTKGPQQGLKQHPFLTSLDPLATPHQQLATPRGSSVFGSPFVRSSEDDDSEMRVYAVKKSKSSLHGDGARARRMEEAKILKELGQHEHVLEFFGSWEDGGHLYIQTEFCENGSLDKFLWQHGNKGRLDEFRVWKMLLELCLVSSIMAIPGKWFLLTVLGSSTHSQFRDHPPGHQAGKRFDQFRRCTQDQRFRASCTLASRRRAGTRR